MAADDGDDERQRPWVWPWVILMAATIATVLIWKATTDSGRSGDAVVPHQTSGTAGARRDAVVDFLEFAEDTSALARMDAAHDYTAEGLRKLRAALEQLADARTRTTLATSFERLRHAADSIQRDPSSLEHADLVRRAFTHAAGIIESLGDVPSDIPLRSTAQSIDADRPLLDQRERVGDFFCQAAREIRTASHQQR